jgi:hypothetical protein
MSDDEGQWVAVRIVWDVVEVDGVTMAGPVARLSRTPGEIRHAGRPLGADTDEVLAELGIKDDPLLDVATELEKIALHDDYFIEKKLYPNIDFYSGITLKAMGFPTTMFTVLFAVARTVGWIAQWKEMIEDPEQKIGRPRQLYIGATERPYVPIERRT